MTNREFTMLASLITRKAAAWAHEGIHDTSRDGDTVLDDSASRFCKEIRSILDRIEVATFGAR